MQEVAILREKNSTERTPDVRNFNFAFNFFKNGGFWLEILHFWKKISGKKIFRKLSDSPKFRWAMPLSTAAKSHDGTENGCNF